MTDLRAAVEEYLGLRRALGFKLERAGGLLSGFIDHLEAKGASTVTTELAVEWATGPRQASAWWWQRRLTVVRGFARHLQAFDPATEVPPTGLIDAVPPRATPYLFSDVDVVGLLAAAKRLRPPLRAATYRTLVGLLAVTGMRVSEAINLDDSDVDDGVVVVRRGKFGKTRQLVVHPSTFDALDEYRRRRRQHCPKPSTDAYFVSTVGTRLLYPNVRAVFQHLTHEVGLASGADGRRPTLHGLRHSFVVNTLARWYAAGLEVGPRLPALSTYLGHARPADSYWYMTATPELLAMAARRLERSLQVLS
jgi:integrase/recombinase XerD